MKKAISILLALVMVLSMLPMSVFAAEATVIDSQTDLSLVADVTKTNDAWTAPSDGTVTVAITSVNPGIQFWFGDNLPKSTTKAASYDFDVVGGSEYVFKICGYYNWGSADATVSYTVSFTPAEGGEDGGEVTKAESVVSETALVLGDNTLTLDATAVNTIYAFEPTEEGTYTFTAPEGATVGYWGAGSWFLTNPNATTNTCEWECTGVGQSAYIGIAGVEGSFTLNVAKTADAEEQQQTVYVDYVNQHTPNATDKALSDGLTMTEVNIAESHSAVLGTDGYYHLDAADGPILFADLITSEFDLTQAFYSAYGALTMRGKVGENYYDFLSAMRSYASTVYTTDGLYPLTIDLINYFEGFGAYQGWYMNGLSPFAEINAGNVVSQDLVLCSYDPSFTGKTEEEEDPSEPAGPDGSMESPYELIVPSSMDMDLVAGDEIWYVYTAEEDETLTFELSNLSDEYGFIYLDVFYDAPGTGWGDVYNTDLIMNVDVAAGQTIYIKAYYYEAVSGTISVSVPAEPVAGATKEDAIIITDDNSDDDDATITFTTPEQPAETTIYYAAYKIQNMDLTVTGEGNFQVTYNGQPYMAVNGVVTIPGVSAENMYTPAYITILGENAGTYDMVLSSPEGDMMNPAELNTTDYNGNTATIEAGDQDGYYFTWTATADGELVLTMADSNADGWQLYAYNLTTYAQSETIYSDGDATSLTIEVSEGDNIQVVANTYDAENPYSAPAGTVVFDATFNAKQGTEGNPYYIYDQDEATVAVIDYAANAEVGETYYSGYGLGGTTLTFTAQEGITVSIDGVEVTSPVVVPAAASNWNPTMIKITNTGSADAIIDLDFTYPAGTSANPAYLPMGEDVVELAEGNEGYFYQFVAPCNGTLTFSVEGENWTYVINNPGDPEDWSDDVYGDLHYFNDDPVVASEDWDVKVGDVLTIQVSTTDPDIWWSTPAGTVTVNATFKHEKIAHTEAVAPGCHYIGNVEYWYCSECQGYWTDEACTELTNAKNVILPATGSENLVHFDAVAPGCHSNGNIEYWYCPDCDGFWADEACTQVTNSKNVVLPATGGDVEHVAEKAPTCEENGNTEYWYCKDCEQVWQDEALTQLTNQKNVIVAATGHSMDKGTVTVEPTCTKKGEMTYKCENCDHTETEDIAKLGHDWDEGKVTTKATCTKKGTKTYTCLNDSEHTKTEKIDKLDHDFEDGECTVCGIDEESAQTGDMMIILVSGMMFVAMAALAVLLLNKKRFTV